MNKELSNGRRVVRILAQSVLAGLVLVSMWGCKGGSSAGPDAGLNADQKAISDLIYKVSDSSGNLERLRSLYTKDKAPSSTDAEKYKGYMFFPKGEIVVSGNTAAVTVGIEKGSDAGPVLVEKPWTAVKEADGWKLGDTPLP